MKRFLSLLGGLLLATAAHGAGLSWMNRCEPRSLGTLQGWWKQDSLNTLADGTSVTNWPDSTGGTHAAVQTTAAFEPVFKTGIFGSAGGVRFTSTDSLSTQQFMDTSSGSTLNSITTTGDWTVFCVVTSNATGTSSTCACIGGNAYVTGTGMRTVSANGGDVFQSLDEGVVDNTTSGNALRTTGQPIAGVWGAQGGSVVFYSNKANTTAGGSYGTFKFNFLAARTGSGFLRLNGDMAELVIMFNAVSSSQVLALYGSYWRPKYSNLP